MEKINAVEMSLKIKETISRDIYKMSQEDKIEYFRIKSATYKKFEQNQINKKKSCSGR